MVRREKWMFWFTMLIAIIAFVGIVSVFAQPRADLKKRGVTMEQIQERRARRVTQAQRKQAAVRFQAMRAAAAKASLASAGQLSNTTAPAGAPSIAPSDKTQGGAS